MYDAVTRHVRNVVRCALVVLAAAPACAQTFYKWTDERGIVHFADAPPANVKNVEERAVSAPPVVRQTGEATPEAGQATITVGSPAGPAAAAPTGPARVVLLSRETPRISPSAIRVMGRVRNAGGETASNVTVEVTVVDETQGTECMREEVEVEPSTLEGGKAGTFDVTLDDPCLYGAANLNVEPRWQ